MPRRFLRLAFTGIVRAARARKVQDLIAPWHQRIAELEAQLRQPGCEPP